MEQNQGVVPVLPRFPKKSKFSDVKGTLLKALGDIRSYVVENHLGEFQFGTCCDPADPYRLCIRGYFICLTDKGAVVRSFLITEKDTRLVYGLDISRGKLLFSGERTRLLAIILGIFKRWEPHARAKLAGFSPPRED